MQENQIKGTTHFADLQESKEWEIKELKENISTLSKRLDNFDSVIDRNEQYSRRNCVLLHGLEEGSNKNTDQRVTDVLSRSMGETIYIQDIDQTHRLPRKKAKRKIKASNCNLCTLQHQRLDL